MRRESKPERLAFRRRKNHLAVLPPSTTYDAPVMNDALSDARNVMIWAISSGLPIRLSGTVAASPAFLSALPVKRFSMSVSIGSGATMLMRTPDAAASRAADFVNPSTACLLAAYTDAPAAPVRPYVDDTLIGYDSAAVHCSFPDAAVMRVVCIQYLRDVILACGRHSVLYVVGLRRRIDTESVSVGIIA
jgi:hypothetical protein